MKLRKIIAVISILTITAPLGVLVPPQNAQAEGPLSTDGCAFGQCGVPAGGGGLPTATPGGTVQMPASGAAGAVKGVLGPSRTVSGWGDAVNVTNPYIGIASPVLNAIAGFTGAETQQSLFEWLQEFVLEALKKRLLDMMVAEIVRWIQNGEEPRFVVDWQQYLEDAGQVAAGEFAQRIGAGILCEPFAAQIQVSIAPEIDPDFNSRTHACTLDDIVGNIENFYKDFSAGGWIAYQEAWELNNNVFGSFLLAQSSQRLAAAEARLAAQNEATTGSGFLPVKACREAIGGTGPDLDKDGIPGDVAASCDIVTPGSVVEELTKKAITVDFDFIVNAEQLSTYLAAIADAAFNRLIRDGVNGLRGLSTSNAPSGGFIQDGDSCSDAFPINSPLRGACEGYLGSNDRNFEATRDDILDELDDTRYQYLSAKTFIAESITVSQDLLEFLEGEPERCTDQAQMNEIEAKITELENNELAIDIILADIEDLRIEISSISLNGPNPWAALTEAMQNATADINVEEAAEIATAADLQYQSILVAAELIEDDVRDCN